MHTNQKGHNILIIIFIIIIIIMQSASFTGSLLSSPSCRSLESSAHSLSTSTVLSDTTLFEDQDCSVLLEEQLHLLSKCRKNVRLLTAGSVELLTEDGRSTARVELKVREDRRRARIVLSSEIYDQRPQFRNNNNNNNKEQPPPPTPAVVTTAPPPPATTTDNNNNSNNKRAVRRSSYSLMTKMMKHKALLSRSKEGPQLATFEGKCVLFHQVSLRLLHRDAIFDFEEVVVAFVRHATRIRSDFEPLSAPANYHHHQDGSSTKTNRRRRRRRSSSFGCLDQQQQQQQQQLQDDDEFQNRINMCSILGSRS